MGDIERIIPKMRDYICVDCRKVFNGRNVICPYCYSPSVVRATAEMREALGVPLENIKAENLGLERKKRR